MELKFEFQSEDNEFALSETKSLKKWLENESSLEQLEIKQEHAVIEPGHAGAELLSILQIVLSSALIGELSKIIQVWFQERSKRKATLTPELKLLITKPNGTKIEIDSKNLGAIEKALVEKLT